MDFAQHKEKDPRAVQMNSRCPRCGAPMHEGLTVCSLGETCTTLACPRCGNRVDEVILENRTPEKRRYWQRRAQAEAGVISRARKIGDENEPEALYLSF